MKTDNACLQFQIVLLLNNVQTADLRNVQMGHVCLIKMNAGLQLHAHLFFLLNAMTGPANKVERIVKFHLHVKEESIYVQMGSANLKEKIAKSNEIVIKDN